MEHSDDMADAFRTAEKLEKENLNGSLINALLEHGDNLLDSVNSDDLIEAMNKSGKSPDEIAREFNILYKHRTNVPLPDMDSIYKADLRIKTRPLNTAENAADFGIANNIKNFRSYLGDKSTLGNAAAAYIDIPDFNERTIYSFSGYETLEEATNHNAKLNESGLTIAWAPKDSSFTPFEAPNKGQSYKNAYLRTYDTEYKILSEIDRRLNGNINATGKVTLFTEKTCCDSCTDVIAQFSEKYPNIEVEIVHNNDIPIMN